MNGFQVISFEGGRPSNFANFKVCVKVLYACHYNSLLIINHSWILIVHKNKILRKNLLKKTFLAFKNGVKSILTAGYNGARKVVSFLKFFRKAANHISVLFVPVFFVLNQKVLSKGKNLEFWASILKRYYLKFVQSPWLKVNIFETQLK